MNSKQGRNKNNKHDTEKMEIFTKKWLGIYYSY